MDFLRDPIAFFTQWLQTTLLGWGLAEPAAQVVGFAIGAFMAATGAMLFVTVLIWAERKLIGRIQDRYGPNRVGPFGIFQSIADLVKIFIKEHIDPVGMDWLPFNLAPVLSVAAVLTMWVAIPFAVTIYGVDFNVGLLYLVAVGGLGELAIIMAGWGSNNKYALLGAFRAVGMFISYEVPMVITLLIPVMLTGSLSMNEIVRQQEVWYIVVSPLAALIFFITQVAEVGRSPFDLTEAESELVSGFNVEYSGLKFGMFYVADFLHAFTISLLFSALFLGGWRGPGAAEIPILGFIYFAIKSSLVYFLVILMRGSLPRFRVDHMMDFNWKLLTPISLVLVILTALALKLMAGLSLWVQIPVLLVLNGLVFVLAQQMITGFFRRRRPREVGDRSRPVARYSPPQSDAGSQG
ncbi:MAG TPA: NADH-quinone oxidoreductase subunit NuoH [Anaerolineaceae bacterium]|jgi:NADH-quinone oxidoreductase subunit H|nr:NADH-quinone oxidoreductase subunit NuoH [Anaerolineaceae bacterium]